jgi:putative peptidoglycan lipid II flippase
MASRVLGLVRDRLWAGGMAGSQALDAFLSAFALPNMLRELFGDGALAAAFLPRYAQLRAADPQEAAAFAGAVVARLAVVLAVIAVVFMGMAAVVAWLGAGKAALVAVLALPMLPYLVFICLVAVLSAVVQVHRLFWVPAAMPVVLNLVLISTAWLGTEAETRVLPWAVLAAGVLQLAAMAWAVRACGAVVPLSLRAHPAEADLRSALAPVVLSSGVFQLNVFLGQQIAHAWAAAGAVACLYFANRLLQFPLALISHSVTAAAGPEVAERARLGWPASGELLRSVVGLQVFWLLPAAMGLAVVAEPLVRLIYQTGAFGEDAVGRTVAVTRLLALGLVPVAINRQLARVFHAHHDTRTPMRVTLLAVFINIVLSLALVATPLAEAGIALAGALAAGASCAAYAVVLRRRGAGAIAAWRDWLRPVCGAGLMAVVVQALLLWWPQPAGPATLDAALRLGAATALGAAAYVACTGFGFVRRRLTP